MGNVHMEARDINYRGGQKKMSVEEALKNTSGEAAAIAQLQQDVSDLNDVKANKITIAPAFSAEASYDPGDLVYYNGLTYRCVNAHSGEWDADDFAATTIDNELSELRSGLTNLLKYKTFNEVATDTANHLYSTGISCDQYVCLGGCTPYNPNFMIQLSNIEKTTTGYIRYRLYDVANNQIVSDNAAYVVELVFVDKSMLSELVITP